MSMNKITLWKNLQVDDWTVEGAIIASNDDYLEWLFEAKF